MKTHELFEGGKLYRGRYEYGHNPTSRDKGLGHFYNSVLPALSRSFDIPMGNFKARSDWGFGWQNVKSSLYSTEKGMMRVMLRKKDLDAELIQQMLPKALKNELSKTLLDVEVSDAVFTPANEDLRQPAFLELKFRSKYPQEWLDFDKQRYSISWN